MDPKDESFGESFLEPDEEDKVEAIKLLSAWQSAIGSLSNTRVNSTSENSLSLSQSIEEDLPLLAIDLDQFQFQSTSSSDIYTIRMLWSILCHGEEELNTSELTLSQEEEFKRAHLPERTIKKGSSTLLTPSSSSSSPMAVLFTTSTGDFVRSPVELISTLFSSIEEEEECASSWNDFSEQFFGSQAAFHTTTLTLSVDVQAWARVKQSSSSSSSLRLAVFPYPSIPLIQSMWSTLTHSLEQSPSETCKETNEFVQKRIVVLDVLRGLIESSHRCINMKAVLWKEVQRIAKMASETADIKIEEKEDISRSWQLLPLTSITSHPLIKILVLVLDRTPFENIENVDVDDDDDDDEFSQQQPREIAAANILHAAAIAIASKNKSITIKEEEIPIASWCTISAHIAADCLDMLCGAYHGFFTSSITTTTTNTSSSTSTYAYQVEEEEEEEEMTYMTVKAITKNSYSASNSIPPPPLPMFNQDEDEEDEVISAMKKGIFAVRFPRFSQNTVSVSDTRLGQEGLENDTTVSSSTSRVVFSNKDVSDALLDKALGIKAYENETNSRSPPIPPSTQEERISYVRGSVSTSTSVGVSPTSSNSGTKGSVSRGMPQSTLSRKKATVMQMIEVEEN